jgi:hypothetical protein
MSPWLSSSFGKTMKLIIQIVACAFLLSGCGYIGAGTWEDDPRNWIRAFNERIPPDIEVVRSRYMTTPHWSHEFEYFFHVKNSDTTRKLFVDSPQLTEYREKDDLFLPVVLFFETKPDWFIPDPINQYKIMIRRDEPRGAFRVFIHKTSGDIFVTDHQI